MIRALVHLNGETNIKYDLSENSMDFASKKYRCLMLGNDISVFLRDDQLELLFDLIDMKLHDKTYLQLEDENFANITDLDAAKEIIEMYREREEERIIHNV